MRTKMTKLQRHCYAVTVKYVPKGQRSALADDIRKLNAVELRQNIAAFSDPDDLGRYYQR